MNDTDQDAGKEFAMWTGSEITVHELDRRRADGIDVQLLWSPRTNRVLVSVADERRGDSFELEVDGADALDAFHHPYAYAGRGGGDLPIAA